MQIRNLITNFIKEFSIEYFFFKPIKNYILNLKEYYHLKKLFKSFKTQKLFNKTYVLNVVRNRRSSIFIEVFLGALIAINGGKVKILLDDGIMMHWDTFKINKMPKRFRIDNFPHNRYRFNIFYDQYIFKYLLERRITNKILKFFKVRNLEYIYYSDIVKDLNYENKHNLKNYAESSTIKFFTTSELDLNNRYIKYYFLLSLKNAMISKKVGEYVLNNLKPDFFITSHAIYSTWGPAFDFLKKNGIECINLAGGNPHSLDPQDFIICYTKKQTLTRCRSWQEYKNIPVTEEMKKKVNEYFNLRVNHKTMDTKVYYKNITSNFRIDKNSNYKFHIAIFPNVIWDGNIRERHIAFSGIIDWVISTLEFLKNKKDIMIYLKLHPSEVTLFKGTKKIEEIIQKYIESTKIDNLIILSSENILDTYEFVKSGIDFGLVYDGILALELPYLKVPVLLGGVKGRFSIENGNFIINNREEYFNSLRNIENLIKDFHDNYERYYNNIVRFTYWYIFDGIVKFPTMPKVFGSALNLFQLEKEDLVLDEKILKFFI